MDGDLTPDNGGEIPAKADEDPVSLSGSDLVREALADARRMSRTSGKDKRAERRATRRANLGGRGPGGFSGPGPDDRDPHPIGELLAGYVADRGWERPLAEARVFADWPAIVGPDVAAHCEPVALTAGELKVSAESTAWATQLRMLTGTILARLATELGPEVVRTLHVTGPVGPTWKRGRFSVRGARGPRDTYG